MENTDTPLDVDYLLKGLAWYFFPVNSFSKQNQAMRRCMKIPRILEVRLSDLNQCLASFTGATMADKFGVNELNGILLNSIPNS